MQINNEQKTTLLLDSMEKYTFRNMGQKKVYLKDSVGIIQRRGTEFLLYTFNNKNSLDGLDVKDATSFKKFSNHEELAEYLKANLD
ncbi:MAG: hypothetical protein ACK4IX_06305 [Candidatus Sericytochromatia bacterium]